MAMRGSGGGGYGSRVHVEKPVRTGSGARAVGPGGVGQLGNLQGSHVTRGEDSSYRGDPFYIGRGYNPVPYGNQKALDVDQGGPGTGRDVHASGGQGCHGGVNPGNPTSRTRDTLAEYGPESSRPRNPNRSSDTDADF